jgi:hypothetical protein
MTPIYFKYKTRQDQTPKILKNVFRVPQIFVQNNLLVFLLPIYLAKKKKIPTVHSIYLSSPHIPHLSLFFISFAPLGRGNISQSHLGRKNMKRWKSKKEDNVKGKKEKKQKRY